MSLTWADWLTWLGTHPEGPPPWARLRVPLRRARVALMTTAGVRLHDQQPFATRAGDVTYRVIPGDTPAIDLVPDHLRYDLSAAVTDINSVFPLERLREFAAEGLIGEVAATHYGFMGYIPDPAPLKRTVAPELAAALQRAGVDAVVLTAGCYTSHRSAALIQRAIETVRIPTVTIAHHPDIARRVRAPRTLVVPFPVGRSLGAAGDRATQRRVLYAALELLNSPPPGSGGVEAHFGDATAR